MKSAKKSNIFFILILILIVFLGAFIYLSSSNLQGNSKNLGDDNTFLTICVKSIEDYPEWALANTDLIIWENPDKSFNFRNSPEDASTMITSPIPPTEMLVDMDFIAQDEISYVTTGENGWNINTLKLKGMQTPDKAKIYEKNEVVSFIDVSPISKDEFVALVVNSNKGTLKYINTNSLEEETISQISLEKISNLKLAVSPLGTYVYLLSNDQLLIFEIKSGKQVEKISQVKSTVWIGNFNILYSDSSGTFIYNLKTNEKSKFEKLGSVSNLAFSPKENGVIAFNDGNDVKIFGCRDWKNINNQQNAQLKALTSERTAITKKDSQFGYWRFVNTSWGVSVLKDYSKFVTVWQRY